MKRVQICQLALCVPVGLALLATAAGCSRQSQAEAVSAAGSRAAVDRVTADTPERTALVYYTTQPGRIEAFETTPLYSKLTGYVDEVLVDIGDQVEKDQVLVRLWVPEMHDEIQHKQALLEQAEAQVVQTESAVRAAEAAFKTAESRVAQARAGVLRAEAEYDRWKAELARITQLVERGSVTEQLKDETLNQFTAADAARQEAAALVEATKAAVVEAQARVDKSRADVLAASAQARVTQAELARSRTLLAYAEIKSPFPGVVTRRTVDTRHFVQPANGGAVEPLLVVARTDRVRVFIDVPETEAALVDAGDTAAIQVQALRGREFTGHVTRTSWALDATNRSLRVEIDLPNERSVLRPGMYAMVHVLLEQRENVLALPATAVVRRGQDTYCCCVESNKIVHKAVTLGLRSGERVEVLSGLDGSETVVLVRADSLADGQAVEVIRPES